MGLQMDMHTYMYLVSSLEAFSCPCLLSLCQTQCNASHVVEATVLDIPIVTASVILPLRCSENDCTQSYQQGWFLGFHGTPPPPWLAMYMVYTLSNIPYLGACFHCMAILCMYLHVHLQHFLDYVAISQQHFSAQRVVTRKGYGSSFGVSTRQYSVTYRVSENVFWAKILLQMYSFPMQT